MESIKTCRIGIFVLIVLVMAVQAGADERTWDGGGLDTEWATAGNWNPDGYSDSDDLTVLSGTPTSAANVIADNGGIITLDGPAAVANFTWDTYIGYTAGVSRLNVLNGANLSNGYGRLGFYGGTSGIATISGAGSKWTNVGDIYAGGGWSDTGGTGEMIITDGGVVSSYWGHLGYSIGSSGTVTVSGAGSEWECSQRIYVGRSGTGELIIADGGTVFSQWHSYVGYNSGSSGTATISGAGSIWNNALTDDFFVGYYGTGVLSITGGGTVWSKYGYLGYKSSGSGEVTVSGAGSTWTNSEDLYVGHSGTGTLNITDGGVVDSDYYVYIGYEAGATGEVTVDGSGSTWTNSGYGLYVGYDGQGTLNITNDGVVNATYKTQVAVNDGAAGEIHFDGGTLATKSLLAGATHLTGTGTINTHGLISDVDILFDSAHGPTQTFTFDSQPGQNITINLTQDSTGYLGAGYTGNGTTSIRDGVSVESSRGYIGYKAGATGTVTVDGSGSTWINTYGLYVGCEGQGTLNITNGGTVSNYSSGRIGEETGSTGEVTVDGSGSTWTDYGNIVVGYHGQGTLNITDGGAVSSESGYLGYYSASGTVTVSGSGSTWTNNSSLYIGGSPSSVRGMGELTVSNGGSVEVGETLKVWNTGTLNIGATGKVTVGQTLVLVQDSTLTAEAGATIHMTGSAFQNESTNSANLAGLGNLKLIFEGGSGVVDPFEAGGEDVGAVIGGFVEANFLLDTLQLGGTAAGKIQLVDDFDNQADGTGVGEAVYVNNLIMNAGATIDLNGLNLYYLNGGSPKQFFCGDATLNGYVDGGDLDILLADWGASVPPANHRADLSGNFFVDGDDLDLILSDWGKGAMPPVPEPASAVLLLSGGVLAMLRRRKK